MQSIPTCSVADVAAAARPHGLTLRQLVERSMEAAGRSSIERLYIGSNFCSQYFLRQPASLWREAFALCRAERIPATLVVPIVSQRNLAEACDLVDKLVFDNDGLIDEVTVNDLGMLLRCADRYGLPANLGRLFSKAPRDPRYPHLFDLLFPVGVPALLDELRGLAPVSGIEVDATHAALDLSELRGLAPNVQVGVHMPYCYLSTGAICELASIRRPVRQKFRPNAPCALECSRCSVTYELPSGARLLKWGRAVYFPNHGCVVHEGERFRMIVSPIDVLAPQPGEGLCLEPAEPVAEGEPAVGVSEPGRPEEGKPAVGAPEPDALEAGALAEGKPAAGAPEPGKPEEGEPAAGASEPDVPVAGALAEGGVS